MLVLKTVLIIGGSTVFGGVFGLLFKSLNKKYINGFAVFSYGIMLTVAVTAMILPCIVSGQLFSLVIAFFGVLCGVIAMNLCERLSPSFQRLLKINDGSEAVRKNLILILAVIIHNLPEGMATGMGFSKSSELGYIIMIGIAVQNIPEGMIVVLSMLSIEKNARKAILITLITAFVEIFGVLCGYYLIEIFSSLVNYFLAFAGGAMLFAVGKEVISNNDENKTASVYLIIFGFLFMVIIDFFLN